MLQVVLEVYEGGECYVRVHRQTEHCERVVLERAYSSRSTPNEHRRVKTWWRRGQVASQVQ